MGTQIRVAQKQNLQRCFPPDVPGKATYTEMSSVRTYALASSVSFYQLMARNMQVSTLQKDRTPQKETCRLAYHTHRELKCYKTRDCLIPSAHSEDSGTPLIYMLPTLQENICKTPQDAQAPSPSPSLNSPSRNHSHFTEEPELCRWAGSLPPRDGGGSCGRARALLRKKRGSHPGLFNTNRAEEAAAPLPSSSLSGPLQAGYSAGPGPLVPGQSDLGCSVF